MLASQTTIPRTHFDGNWRNALTGSARGVDRLDFLLYIVPTLLIPRMNSSRTAEEPKRLLNQVIKACHLCMQWKIDTDELEFIER